MNILSFIFHHANRFSKDKEFYAIKDRILKKYGKFDGYDIQHIPGKKCHSCGGTGQHARYSNTYPYKPYDWDDCWHCTAGWFKWPQWICLERKKFGGYTFHRPLKREFMVKNPFTELGWEVSNRSVIESYIEHKPHWFGRWATLILFLLYDRKTVAFFWKDAMCWHHLVPTFIWRIKWKFERWNWRRQHPPVQYREYVYGEELHEELPF